MGGCTSNVFIANASDERAKTIEDASRRFLEETPWSAMMRSFLVYLCVLAGLYFALEDPFKDSTPAQYLRLAGTVSVLAFLVGYDPTRIQNWIGLIPQPKEMRGKEIFHETLVKDTFGVRSGTGTVRDPSQPSESDSDSTSNSKRSKRAPK